MTSQRARVWDLPVRAFHWLIVLSFSIAWWSAETGRMSLHRYTGYTILVLVLFRVAWGFVGGRTARFGEFVTAPGKVWRYVRRHFVSFERPVPSLGHNPLGGWSVVIMLALLSAQLLTGLFAVDVDGIDSGPFSKWVSFSTGRTCGQIHELIFNALLLVIGIHLAAIVFYWARGSINLVSPMFSGYRTWSESVDAVEIAPRKLAWRSALLLAAIALVVCVVLFLA